MPRELHHVFRIDYLPKNIGVDVNIENDEFANRELTETILLDAIRALLARLKEATA